MHDTGLVYKREEESPAGHEGRSVEYARELLKKKGFSEDIVENVVECINQTISSDDSSSVNAKIVNTTDAVSKFITLHYFAKASFFNNWDFFYDWTRKKLKKSLDKIHFDQEKELIMPIYNWMNNAIELYDKHNKNYPLKEKEGEGEKNGLSRDN